MTGQTAVSMLFTSVNIMAPIMFNTVVATMGGAGWACPRTNKFRPAQNPPIALQQWWPHLNVNNFGVLNLDLKQTTKIGIAIYNTV